MFSVRAGYGRFRREARDALELVLLPGLAAVLPWRCCFWLFKNLAQRSWLYRASSEKALAEARQRGWVQDSQRWLAERRLTTLVDHADHYLARTRSNAWMRRHVDVVGDWGMAGQAGVLMTFHWGAGLWSLRHAQAAGLRPHMLVAAVDGVPFAGRTVLHRYIRARMVTVEQAEGRPVIYVPGSMRALLDALQQGDQVLAVMDVPSDQVNVTKPVALLGVPVQVPSVLPRLAVEKRLPVTVFVMGLDLDTGRRFLRLNPLGIHADADELAAAIFSQLDQVMKERPAAWHLWSESERFFR